MSRLAGAAFVAGLATVLAGAIPVVATATSAAQETHLLIVVGVGGEPEYTDAFHEWGAAMFDAARVRNGLPAENVVFLADQPQRDPERISARSNRENIEQALREMAARSRAGDQIFILLIGHGSYDGHDARFNLPGPNLTATDFATLLDIFADRTIAFVHTGSASGAFVQPLAAPNRAIITATRSGGQNNATVFPRFFVEAFAADGADTDRDGRVSLLEAFEYARREVTRFYQDQGRLATEAAVIDDAGTGQGATEIDRAAGEGALAARIFLRAGPATIAADPATRERLRELYAQRDALETQLDTLRALRATMDPERYEEQLERLLLEMAEVGREIRRLGGDEK